MTAKVRIAAGVCGFVTEARAACDDGQHVRLAVDTDCANISRYAAALGEEPFDAFQEISGAAASRLLTTARACLTGCCAGCVVPSGLFKALQVAAGLALPRPVSIDLVKEG